MLFQEIKLCEKCCKFKRKRDLTEQTIVCTFECGKMQLTDRDVQEAIKVNKENANVCANTGDLWNHATG